MTAVPMMVDLSSNNGVPDLRAHFKAGYRTIALKATEGTTYNWAGDDALVALWHQLGGRTCNYHFAQPGDPVAQADFFVSAIRARFDRRRDFVVIDCERAGVDGRFVQAFIDRVITRLGNVNGLIYGSPSFLNAAKIRNYRGWRLWLAEYGPKADVPSSWPTWMAWQFTDRATRIPGIPGAVDCSHIKSWLLPGVIPTPKVLWPTLKPGAKGPWVHKLQDLLNQHGAHLVVDGDFGPKTRDALNAFKRKHGWAADGVCGYRVWKALGA